jgi:hypothetical protein
MAKTEFQRKLDEQLQTIETEEDRIARVQQIKVQMAQLKDQMAELNRQLQHELEGMVGELAISVRKSVPGLAVSLNNGRCNVKHLSNNLSLRPDFDSGMWDVEPNVSGRRFRKHHGHALKLSKDVAPISGEISNFFRKRYKRLNNESMPPIKAKPNKDGSTFFA